MGCCQSRTAAEGAITATPTSMKTKPDKMSQGEGDKEKCLAKTAEKTMKQLGESAHEVKQELIGAFKTAANTVQHTQENRAK